MPRTGRRCGRVRRSRWKRPGSARRAAASARRWWDSAVWAARLRLPFQIALTLVFGLLVPFVLYVMADRAGFPLAKVSYFVVVVALLITAYFIWVEGFRALPATELPAEPAEPAPPATAVIAA